MTGMHYCARPDRGDKLLDEIYPYIYHLCRSVCHKPNYVVIALQQCCVTAAVHPKVRTAVESSLSLSILGRKGSNMAPDRLVEWINQFQQQRGGLGGDFDKKLHTGPALVPLLHATHVRHTAHSPATHRPVLTRHHRRMLAPTTPGPRTSLRLPCGCPPA